jgi:hypothetical protein
MAFRLSPARLANASCVNPAASRLWRSLIPNDPSGSLLVILTGPSTPFRAEGIAAFIVIIVHI